MHSAVSGPLQATPHTVIHSLRRGAAEGMISRYVQWPLFAILQHDLSYAHDHYIRFRRCRPWNCWLGLCLELLAVLAGSDPKKIEMWRLKMDIWITIYYNTKYWLSPKSVHIHQIVQGGVGKRFFWHYWPMHTYAFCMDNLLNHCKYTTIAALQLARIQSGNPNEPTNIQSDDTKENPHCFFQETSLCNPHVVIKRPSNLSTIKLQNHAQTCPGQLRSRHSPLWRWTCSLRQA